ncbi:hypothetical protein C0Q70_11489 [Pomacea canaliculata]|uniref:Dopey N-terminal domain-containing protein n=1 Tax=Pomacea canaliculata TaxID=400727 RepID=A0A2T7P638_POMCA|nr:hypothetical protein C0Q70_11489 [Pomacea canaliculata]
MSMLTVEECELLSDSKYRSYISQVEKALKSFEYTSEWADLISALGKLNKVLLNHLKYPVIPKKVTIGKRLAQCLHPALPSGVHLKALEAYDIIFKCIGTQRLAQDLFVYSAGLFPLLAYAAMSVKPVLLTVYEKHFVLLGRQIKPGLNGLLLGLLPGLEEGAEYFDSVRLPATTFLLNHFNKRSTMEDQLHMMGLDIDLVVQAMCSALQDCSVLVQRSMLDFLLLAFPMHNGQLTRNDLSTVVEAAINVVLRRDMSLNRRLYLWFLGNSAMHSQAVTTNSTSETASFTRRVRADSSSTTSEMDLSYFHTFSKELLVMALKRKLSTAGEEEKQGEDGHLPILKPFRILISLLDKPEIGPVIIEDVLLSVFRSLYRWGSKGEAANSSSEAANAQTTSALCLRDSKHIDELIKTANLLFGSFESYFIWEFLGRLFSSACEQTRLRSQRSVLTLPNENEDDVHIKELCNIVEFLLDVISLDVYPETTTEHVPDLLYQVITAATGCIKAASDAELTAVLSMCSKILSRVQPSMATPSGDVDPFDSESLCRLSDVTSFHKPDVESPPSDGNSGDCVDNTSFDAHGKSGQTDSSCCRDGCNAGRVGDDKVTDNVENKSSLPMPETSKGIDQSSDLAGRAENIHVADQGEAAADCKKDDDSQKDNENSQKDDDTNKDDNSQKVSSGNVGLTVPPTVDDVAVNAESIQNVNEFSSKENSGQKSEDGDDAVNSMPLKSATKDRDVRKLSASRQKSRDDRSNGHLTLMQQCLASFQELFHCIITQRILESEAVCEKFTELITLMPTDSGRTCEQDSAYDASSTCSLDDSIRSRLQELRSHPRIKPRTCTEQGQDAFSRACRLLVDFASFPLYCADYQTVIDQMYNTEEDNFLPPWLQDLLTCACFVQNFPVQASAVTSMLELIILTQSVQSETRDKSRDSGRHSVSEGRVSVVILPALLPRHLQHINENTIFYQVTAQELWNHLGSDNADEHHRTAELFHTLHQVTPKAWICEDAIGMDLISNDEDTRLLAYRKFSMLWHLTRNMKSEPTLKEEPRTFDRSMFVLLDSLKEEGSTAKSLALTWLTQAVQRGDISRILRPILLMLLHPDTARISIQHVSVQETKKTPVSEVDSDSNHEANIYAISSDGGNVTFHVNHNHSFKASHKSSEDLKSFAMAVMNEKGGQTSTAPVRAHSEAELSYERVNPDNLKLRINPFGAPNLSGARRLNKETCQKEGIFFDGKEEVDPAPELSEDVFAEKESTAESVVADIMEELLSRVLQQVAAKGGQDDDSLGKGQRKTSLISSSGQMCDQDLLNAIESASLDVDSTSSSELDIPRVTAAGQDVRGRGMDGIASGKGTSSGISGGGGSTPVEDGEELSAIHPLHMHLLLYTQPYDYRRTLYALSTLHSMLSQCPRLVVTAMATTSIAAIRAPHLLRLQTLLARHRKSVFGKNFFGEMSPEVLSSYRSNMFLEILISLCLYCMRGYYPNLMASRLTQEELQGNHLVHSQAAEVLILLLSELLAIMRDSGRNFVSYISDLLARCKLQKALLHTLLASVFNARFKPHSGKKQPSLTEAIIEFNESEHDPCVQEAFQLGLLRLILVTMMLENCISSCVGSNPVDPSAGSGTEWDRLRTSMQHSLTRVRYRATDPIAQQPMFLSECEKQTHSGMNVPPDHVITLLEGLTTLCHYCLLDSNAHVSIGQPAPAPTSVATETASAGHILTNLINVFNPISSIRETSPQRDMSPVSPVMEARSNLLSIMPRIMACMATLWKAVSHDGIPAVTTSSRSQAHNGFYKLLMGDPKVVRQYILELLSPISLLHGSHLLGAFAVAWNDRRQKIVGQSRKAGILVPTCEDQLLLVELVSAIKVLPADTLIQTVKSVLKQPPQTELAKNKKSVPLEVNVLQFFFAYVQRASGTQLLDSWPSLLTLVKGCSSDGASASSHLHASVKAPAMEDKKSQKDLQDMTQKLLEAVTAIAGLSLQQTTWLRRNYAVKPGKQTDMGETEDADIEQEQGNDKSRDLHSFRLTAPILDVVYSSEEKEKVVPFLTTLLQNVFPYLRHHSGDNLPSYRACSQLLSSVSGYQYTRKAWRKEGLDLLLDPNFFQMDGRSLAYWRRLAESLRLAQVPTIMSQVFLCFRVLILRMSPQHLTSLWPTMITELVQVFLQIEQELSTETDEFKTQLQRIAALDSSWAHLGNGLNAHNNPSWLSLYLSACRLLDMCLVLPADTVPQFQLYRWAFIGTAGEENRAAAEENKPKQKDRPRFTPHIVRLARLLNTRLQQDTPILRVVEGRPLLTVGVLRSLAELQPFFNTLCLCQSEKSASLKPAAPSITAGLQVPSVGLSKSQSAPECLESRSIDQPPKTCRQHVEELLERDFLEPVS